jgi:hypothetical protein
MGIERTMIPFAVSVASLLVGLASDAMSLTDRPEPVVIMTNEPSNAPWVHGTIDVVLRKNGKAALSLDFSMPRGKIDSMVLRSKDWKVDITDRVSMLEEPYPLRSQAWIHKMDAEGTISDAALLLPFGPGGGQCQIMRIHVVGGRISEAGIVPAQSSQCEP